MLADAHILLERLLRMDTPGRRRAWAWRELARARRWLGEPASAVDEAYANATELAGDETRFWREWGHFSERGLLAYLTWQSQQLHDLRVPEHLHGTTVRRVKAVRRAADDLKDAISRAIDQPGPGVRHLMQDLVTAQTRLEGSGPQWLGTALAVAKNLTLAVASAPGREAESSTDAAASGTLAAVARALANLNMRYLDWLPLQRPVP